MASIPTMDHDVSSSKGGRGDIDGMFGAESGGILAGSVRARFYIQGATQDCNKICFIHPSIHPFIQGHYIPASYAWLKLNIRPKRSRSSSIMNSPRSILDHMALFAACGDANSVEYAETCGAGPMRALLGSFNASASGSAWRSSHTGTEN